jgi:hypothetical protein
MGLDDYKNLTSKELAERWGVPESWVRNQTRRNCADPIPHIKLGRYVRFRWPSRDLYLWYRKHLRGFAQPEPESEPKPLPRKVVRPVIRRKS